MKKLYRKTILPIIKNYDHWKRRLKLINKFTGTQIKQFKLDKDRFFIVLNSNNGYIDEEIFMKGVFEPKILKLIKELADSSATFVDVGANIGQHSLFASKYFNKVLAFEPLPKLFNQINLSKKLNEFNNIQVYNYGLSDKLESKKIFCNKTNIGESSLVKIEHSSSENINLVKFDNIITERVDLIKIDVEGFEYFVLKGMIETIKKFKPKIIMEYSPYYYDKQDPHMAWNIFNLLNSLNYKFRDIHSGVFYTRFEDLPLHQTDLLLIID